MLINPTPLVTVPRLEYAVCEMMLSIACFRSWLTLGAAEVAGAGFGPDVGGFGGIRLSGSLPMIRSTRRLRKPRFLAILDAGYQNFTA